MLFQYAQLQPRSIRLVRVHPHSTPSDIHVSVEHQEQYSEDDVHYKALWYFRPNHDDEMQTITMQGRTKLVPTLVFHAMRVLVSQHDVAQQRFWIPYLSINQGDEAEKQSQMAQLDSIYSSADEVLVWVESGDGRDDSDGEDCARIRNAPGLQRACKLTLLGDDTTLDDEVADALQEHCAVMSRL